MNHFNNLPMDIREVILNKKHSLEMDELKTAHALAIAEFDCFYYCYKIGLKESITWLE